MTTPSTTSIAEADYGAIENALQSTEKGRRFLRTYIERNRSLESRRLLRSISRLHRAALGEPGLNAEISRDLSSVLRTVSRHRKAAAKCSDLFARSAALENSLEEVEFLPYQPPRVHRGKGCRDTGQHHGSFSLRGHGGIVPRRAEREAFRRIIFLFFERSALTCRMHAAGCILTQVKDGLGRPPLVY